MNYIKENKVLSILILLVVVCIFAGVMHERNVEIVKSDIASLKTKTDKTNSDLQTDTALNNTQGVVIEQIVVQLCKGDVQCAQEFITRVVSNINKK